MCAWVCVSVLVAAEWMAEHFHAGFALQTLWDLHKKEMLTATRELLRFKMFCFASIWSSILWTHLLFKSESLRVCFSRGDVKPSDPRAVSPSLSSEAVLCCGQPGWVTQALLRAS